MVTSTLARTRGSDKKKYSRTKQQIQNRLANAKVEEEQELLDDLVDEYPTSEGEYQCSLKIASLQ